LASRKIKNQKKTGAPKTSRKQQQQQPAMPGPALWSGECFSFCFFFPPCKKLNLKVALSRSLLGERSQQKRESRVTLQLQVAALHFRMPSLFGLRSMIQEPSGSNNYKLSL